MRNEGETEQATDDSLGERKYVVSFPDKSELKKWSTALSVHSGPPESLKKHIKISGLKYEGKKVAVEVTASCLIIKEDTKKAKEVESHRLVRCQAGKITKQGKRSQVIVRSAAFATGGPGVQELRKSSKVRDL